MIVSNTADLAKACAPKESEEEFEEDPSEEMSEDLSEALDMLKLCAVLADYISDPLFCRALSKRERDAMARLSDEVNTLVDRINAEYTEALE